MELDQLIFKKILNYFKRRKNALSSEEIARRVHLEEISGKLNILARALAGESIEIVPSEREGGWSGNAFFLPREMMLFHDVSLNASFYLFRLFYLVTQRELNLNWPQGNEHPLEESRRQALITSEKVLAVLFDEFPNLAPIHSELRQSLIQKNENGELSPEDASWLYGRWMKGLRQKDNIKNMENDSDVIPESDELKITTEMRARQADEIEVLQVDKKAQEDYTLTHNFEKVETVDEVSNQWRDFDGDDHLNQDADALQDLNLKQMVRVDDPVHSIYRAEFVNDATIAESKDADDGNFTALYKEWDYKMGAYKPAFCRLYHKYLNQTKPDYYKNTLSSNRRVLMRLRKIFARLHNDRIQVRRLPFGEMIDIDAVNDMLADINAGRTPDERVYISRRKRRMDLSILFLLDLSLSSDGYAKGNRIIDVEKQVSILYGEVLNEYGVDFQIDGFFSKTRNNTTYITLKGFDESWDKAKLKIGAVRPMGYTRIGPAIRHATSLINRRPFRKKWIILLSDGKPNDYDRYEGKYGIHDIKQALREMTAMGINNFALAIEEQAKYYLPQMFGKNHYEILSSPMEMVQSLAKLYKRIEQR